MWVCGIELNDTYLRLRTWCLRMSHVGGWQDILHFFFYCLVSWGPVWHVTDNDGETKIRTQRFYVSASVFVCYIYYVEIEFGTWLHVLCSPTNMNACLPRCLHTHHILLWYWQIHWISYNGFLMLSRCVIGFSSVFVPLHASLQLQCGQNDR